MKHWFFLSALCGLLAGCGERNNDLTSDQGTSGSGVYGQGGDKDNVQRARESATDTRPRGGSMQGAGGAGPGFDGSTQGTGEAGTVPAPGSGVGAGVTNTTDATTGQNAPPRPRPPAP